MKPGRLRSSRGMTIVELMVSLGISVGIILLVGGVYVGNINRYHHNKQIFRTEMRSRQSMEYLMQELRNAGYVIIWDTNPDAPAREVNTAVTGATFDSGTDSLTARYVRGPLTSGSNVTTLNGQAVLGSTSITVHKLDFDTDSTPDVVAGTLIAVYSPPQTVNVRTVSSTGGADPNFTIGFTKALTFDFPDDSYVAIVREVSFWVEGSNLMIRDDGSNQILSSNVEDLQVALVGSDAIRLSLTARSERAIESMRASVPPSLENHDRSSESADKFLRRVQLTTLFMRNYGILE